MDDIRWLIPLTLSLVVIGNLIYKLSCDARITSRDVVVCWATICIFLFSFLWIMVYVPDPPETCEEHIHYGVAYEVCGTEQERDEQAQARNEQIDNLVRAEAEERLYDYITESLLLALTPAPTVSATTP
jgi:hypothetical protein